MVHEAWYHHFNYAATTFRDAFTWINVGAAIDALGFGYWRFDGLVRILTPRLFRALKIGQRPDSEKFPQKYWREQTGINKRNRL